MFFRSSDISVRILTVMELQWGQVSARVEGRPFHALSFRLEDGTTLRSDDREATVCRAGDLSFTPAGCAFSKQAEQDRILVVHFTADAPLPETICSLRPRDPEHFRKSFTELLQVWNNKQFGFEHQARILFYGILLDAEQEWARQQSPAGEERLAPAIRQIHDHFADGSLTVDGLSRLCGMSDTYFRRLFVEAFGETPRRYINRLRMARVTELLRSSYYTMERISESCGFNNVNYFSLFVKKETGLSPSLYRKKLLTPPEGE